MCLLGVVSQPSHAEWEQIYSLPTTQAHFITSKGTFLLSDFNDDRKGGIYISSDKGETWTKTDVKDFNYHKFYEADGYVYAMGYNSRIARSNDDGRSWEILNYSSVLKGVVEDKAIDSLVAYAVLQSGDRLYIGDFAGGGVLYSKDHGETWTLTDRESMTINLEGIGNVIDSFYNLVEFKGSIYAFAALTIHRYDIAADKWELVNLNSNFMAVSTIFDDRLVCGRSAPNYDPGEDYLVWTSDGYEWRGMESPEPYGEVDVSRNVRALYSDDTYIYAIGPDGLMPNPEPFGPEYVNAPDFFYTSDFGKNWNRNTEGLPARTYPLTLISDEDYVYTAVYSPIPSETGSGLWRLSKKELSESGVGAIRDTESAGVRFSGSMMELTSVAESVNIYSLAGVTVYSACNVSEVNTGLLGKGAYIYEIVSGGKKVTGKFVR